MSLKGAIKNQDGSMLIYVMVMIATLCVFSVSYSNSILDLKKQIVNTQFKTNISYDTSQVIKLIKLPNGLVESSTLGANQKILTCIKGGPAPGCATNCCNGNIEEGFYYVDTTDNNININEQKKISGPSNAPIYYNENGSVCPYVNGNPQTCAFSVTTTFKANCPGGETSCDHAEYLRVKISIEPILENIKTMGMRKEKISEFIYHINSNYQPEVIADSTVDLYLNDVAGKEIVITGGSGHPSEVQNYIFTKCISENVAVAALATPANQPFTSGTAKVLLKPVSVGTTRLALQINDGGTENSISPEKFININVLPGSAP